MPGLMVSTQLALSAYIGNQVEGRGVWGENGGVELVIDASSLIIIPDEYIFCKHTFCR